MKYLLVLIFLVGCTNNLQIGECYIGEFGHFNKQTIKVKILDLDNGYVLYDYCNEIECRNKNKNSEEETSKNFTYLYPLKIKCP